MDTEKIRKRYKTLEAKYHEARKYFGRPLTLTEKILFSHLQVSDQTGTASLSIDRGKTEVKLWPDRVVMQDATAQMAVLQFMQSQRLDVAVPTSIHCDHLIRAYQGANADLLQANQENGEVYEFLSSSALKYGIDFWKPGSGIIHQVFLENYAFPGGLIIGTDSHTPNAGGLATLAIGVGGSDASEVMAGLPWTVVWPKLIGVKLTGQLQGWTASKDVILKVAGILTVNGGTGKILEYFGEGVDSISCTGRATITNMGAELGATTSVFPYDRHCEAYLRATNRNDLADLCRAYLKYFKADSEIEMDPKLYFDEIIEIDLSKLEPHVVGPHTPDLARPISQLAAEAKEKGYQDNIRVALIGSCTNSSYEDIGRAAHIALQAKQHGVKSKIPLMITPGSETVYRTIERDGMLGKLTDIGGIVLANACGPCIGQWKRTDIKEGELNTIVTSFNRNFRRRNDGNAETMAFITSPEVVIAFALSGSLSFNPLRDTLIGADGKQFLLKPPYADDLPKNGFTTIDSGLEKPPPAREKIQVVVPANSERLALLEPFPPWDGKDFLELPVLVKALGKCTTDHISPAGPWLRYRGHLDKISDNIFFGAINAFTKETGVGLNVVTGKRGQFPQVARDYKAKGIGWIVIGDENYGEGSSREHAAMSPRYLGAKAVIVKSFARIHETNLKKQGVLALIFIDSGDYDKIEEEDKISIFGLSSFSPGKPLNVSIKHKDGTIITITVTHSYSDEQIRWFKAGAALNVTAQVIQ